MQCERLLPAFIAVAATALLLRPCCMTDTSWASLLTDASCALARYTPLILSCCTYPAHKISILIKAIGKTADAAKVPFDLL